MITKICEYCKKEFEITNGEEKKCIREFGHGRLYCSHACSGKAVVKPRTKVPCAYCGKEVKYIRHPNSPKYKFCNIECFHLWEKEHPPYVRDGHWKENGYDITYDGTKNGIKTHRLVMAEHLGRDLLPSEIVHHIDGNRLNNNINNLQLMTRAEHARQHRLKDIKNGVELFGGNSGGRKKAKEKLKKESEQ